MKLTANFHWGFRLCFAAILLVHLIGILWFRSEDHLMNNIVAIAFFLFMLAFLPHFGSMAILSFLCAISIFFIEGSRLFGFFQSSNPINYFLIVLSFSWLVYLVISENPTGKDKATTIENPRK